MCGFWVSVRWSCVADSTPLVRRYCWSWNFLSESLAEPLGWPGAAGPGNAVCWLRFYVWWLWSVCGWHLGFSSDQRGVGDVCCGDASVRGWLRCPRSTWFFSCSPPRKSLASPYQSWWGFGNPFQSKAFIWLSLSVNIDRNGSTSIRLYLLFSKSVIIHFLFKRERRDQWTPLFSTWLAPLNYILCILDGSTLCRHFL